MGTGNDTTQRRWPLTVAVALGLGAAPLLASLLPLSPWTAAAVLLGALLGAGPVLSGEARAARQDIEHGRTLLLGAQWPTLHPTAVLSTLAAALAALQAAWGAVGLLRLGLDGAAAATEKGVTAWMGAQQGFLGQPGLQGSVELVGGLLAVLGLLALLLARPAWRRVLAGLLVLAVALELACGVQLWLSAATPSALLDVHAAWPASWMDGLGEVGLGLAAGLFAAGAGMGVVHAVMHRSRSIAPAGRAARWLPLALTALGLLVLWPVLGALAEAPRNAPAPYGRESAALLLAPAPALGSVGWQAVWFAGLLLAGLAGALALAQPALQRLEGLMGLKTGRAAAALGAILIVIVAPCLLLPGTRETLATVLAMLLLPVAVRWATVDAAGRALQMIGWLGVAGAGVAAGAVGYLRAPRAPHHDDHAVLQGWVLAAGLVLALTAWWAALLGLAALRSRVQRRTGLPTTADEARALRRAAPASPAGPRTRA